MISFIVTVIMPVCTPVLLKILTVALNVRQRPQAPQSFSPHNIIASHTVCVLHALPTNCYTTVLAVNLQSPKAQP